MIKSIVFDFAGVIGTDGYWIWLKEKLPDLEDKKSYFQDLSVQVDDGTITNQKFVQAIATKLQVSEKIVWKEIFKRIIINQDLLILINQLKKKYKIGLLTNYTNEWMSQLIDLYELDKYFDVKVISSLHGIIKPDKKIYLMTLNLLKSKPNETIFVDDRQNNVNGGENVGIKSLLFISNVKLINDLGKLGIKA